MTSFLKTTVIINSAEEGLKYSICSPGDHIYLKCGYPESGSSVLMKLQMIDGKLFCLEHSPAPIRKITTYILCLRKYDAFHHEVVIDKRRYIGELPKGILLVEKKKGLVSSGRCVLEYIKGPWKDAYEVVR